MGQRYVIELESRFVDHVTGETGPAARSLKSIGTVAEETQSKIEKLVKSKARIEIEANNTKLVRKIRESEAKAKSLGRMKTAAVLDVLDKATVKINKVIAHAKNFGAKTYNAVMKIKDSHAMESLRNIGSQVKGLTGKAWSMAVRVKDFATAPLQKIKNLLFSIKSLIAAVIAGFAAQKLIAAPVSLADTIERSRIAFTTKLGSEAAAEDFLQEIYKFDEKSPFDTIQIVGIAQQMMNLGWEADNVLKDLGTIGDWSASLGKGEEGISAVTRALGQMRMKGKLSSEEMLQLTEAGVDGWNYLAKYMGKDITEIREMAEDGAIDVDTAIKGIMAGLGEYSGAATATADKTVTGIIDQIKSLVQTNIILPWGEGMSEGLKEGLTRIRDFIDKNKEALKKFGETLKELGAEISNWFADIVQDTIARLIEITSSEEFKNGTFGEKIGLLWDGLIANPFAKWWKETVIPWWDDVALPWLAEKASSIGESIGRGLTKGLLALLGIDYVSAAEDGISIAGGFVEGFMEGFDGQAITNAFVDAISNIWDALPAWAKVLIGGGAALKIGGTLGSWLGGIGQLFGSLKGVIGSTGNANFSGSGVLGKLASVGYGLTGGAEKAATVTGLSGGKAALIGGGTIAGGITAGIGAIHVIDTFGDALDASKEGDYISARANVARSASTAVGIGAGAAAGVKLGTVIGTAGGPLGNLAGGLIGAGIGALAGMFFGDKIARNIEAAKYESEEMKEYIKEGEMSAEELDAAFTKIVNQRLADRMGDVELSLTEIAALVDSIVWKGNMAIYEEFTAAAASAESSLQSMKKAAQDTNKWMWKAKLGVKFNDEEVASIAASFDDYINQAKSFVENKHYEFTAAVSLLVDAESKEGKEIIESGNVYFANEQKKLDELGEQLSQKVQKALEDDVISTEPVTLPDGRIQLSEAEEIANLQKQIADITQKLADAEMQAELELVKLKFGDGKLSKESYDEFMETMEQTLQQRLNANDEAFIASVSNIKMRLAEEGLSDKEKEALNDQLATIIAGYEGDVETLKAEIKEIELDIISDTFKDVEGLEENTREILEKALNDSLKLGINPREWTPDDAKKFLGIDSLGEETAAEIALMLGGVADQLQLLEIDGEIYAKMKVESNAYELIPQLHDDVSDVMQAPIPIPVECTVEYVNTIEILASEFGIKSPDEAEQILFQLSGAYNIVQQIEIIKEEFGVTQPEAETILWKLIGNTDITPIEELTASHFGIQDSYTFTTQVKLNAIMQKAAPLSGLLSGSDGSGYRGGIFGGDSAMDAFARGGRSDGGIVGGSTRFIRVNEESPEMIIPLSSQRRERALKLWTKTGELLDVPGFARGGNTGGNDEGFSFRPYEPEEAPSQGAKVDVGGVKVEINVQAKEGQNIVEAIRAQANEITETIAGILADAFGDQFENTPARGGVA